MRNTNVSFSVTAKHAHYGGALSCYFWFVIFLMRATRQPLRVVREAERNQLVAELNRWHGHYHYICCCTASQPAQELSATLDVIQPVDRTFDNVTMPLLWLWACVTGPLSNDYTVLLVQNGNQVNIMWLAVIWLQNLNWLLCSTPPKQLLFLSKLINSK